MILPKGAPATRTLFHVTSIDRALQIIKSGLFIPFGMGADRGINLADTVDAARRVAAAEGAALCVQWTGLVQEVVAGKVDYNNLSSNTLYRQTWSAITPGQIMRSFLAPGSDLIVCKVLHLGDGEVDMADFSVHLPASIHIIPG